MNCAQANNIDIVDFLSRQGYQPVRQGRGQVYWYRSPIRDERTASFRVDRVRNTWKDFGTGQGGSLVDLAMLLLTCSTVEEVLAKLSSLQGGPLITVQRPAAPIPREPQIRILQSGPITSPPLIHYLRHRSIPYELAQRYLVEVTFEIHGKRQYSLGFKNDAGGYELRNAYFKGSSMPKAPVLLKGNGQRLAVFEGFFNFLSFAAHMQKQSQPLPDVLVLNSTSFFEKSMTIMASYPAVDLYLDDDDTGRARTTMLCEGKPSNGIYHDKSAIYKNFKDYNKWWMTAAQNKRPHLPGSKSHRIKA